MNYLFFLKRQLFNFGLIVMITAISYATGRYSYVRSIGGLRVEYIIAISLTYIFLGAYVRLLMYEGECDVLD